MISRAQITSSRMITTIAIRRSAMVARIRSLARLYSVPLPRLFCAALLNSTLMSLPPFETAVSTATSQLVSSPAQDSGIHAA